MSSVSPNKISRSGTARHSDRAPAKNRGVVVSAKKVFAEIGYLREVNRLAGIATNRADAHNRRLIDVGLTLESIQKTLVDVDARLEKSRDGLHRHGIDLNNHLQSVENRIGEMVAMLHSIAAKTNAAETRLARIELMVSFKPDPPKPSRWSRLFGYIPFLPTARPASVRSDTGPS